MGGGGGRGGGTDFRRMMEFEVIRAGKRDIDITDKRLCFCLASADRYICVRNGASFSHIYMRNYEIFAAENEKFMGGGVTYDLGRWWIRTGFFYDWHLKWRLHLNRSLMESRTCLVKHYSLITVQLDN